MTSSDRRPLPQDARVGLTRMQLPQSHAVVSAHSDKIALICRRGQNAHVPDTSCIVYKVGFPERQDLDRLSDSHACDFYYVQICRGIDDTQNMWAT
jgi:hypothetical protein